MAEEDIIFGKNRHFFGGIEPSNVRYIGLFPRDASTMKCRLTIQLPYDTIVDGQTLCTVEGAIIRRKLGSPPVDEFDGEFVYDVKSSTTYESFAPSDMVHLWMVQRDGTIYLDVLDEELYTSGEKRYYKAFPYSAQGVYNRSDLNIANIVEYNDGSFIAPVVMITNIEPKYDTGGSSSGAVIYADAGVQIDCLYAYIGRYDRYPTSPSDYEIQIIAERLGIAGDSIETKYTLPSTLSSGDKVYCALFYSLDSGENWIRDPFYMEEFTVPLDSIAVLYGYNLDLDDSDPSTRVSYPAGVTNYEFTAITASSDGDWTDKVAIMPKPCVLYPSGVVKGYLNENDYTKYLDGTDATDDITDANNLGLNVMMEWPKIYTKRWEVNGVYSFRCSNVKVDDTYECWCNINDNGEEIDHFYTGVYLSSDTRDENIRQSISGASRTSETTTSAFTTKCQANGAGWGPEEAIDRMLINDLLTMVYKTTDIPLAILGAIVPGYNSTAGVNNSNGMFYGSNAGIKVFGMENWWTSWGGNTNSYARYISGLYCNKGLISIKLPGNSEYTDVGEISGTSGGYINGTKTTNFGRFPISTGGSSSTYESDALVYSTSYTYSAYATGGVDSYLNGPFALSFMNSTGVSGSLSFKPIDRVE